MDKNKTINAAIVREWLAAIGCLKEFTQLAAAESAHQIWLDAMMPVLATDLQAFHVSSELCNLLGGGKLFPFSLGMTASLRWSVETETRFAVFEVKEGDKLTVSLVRYGEIRGATFRNYFEVTIPEQWKCGVEIPIL